MCKWIYRWIEWMLHEQMDRYIMNGWTDTCRLINNTFSVWMVGWTNG